MIFFPAGHESRSVFILRIQRSEYFQGFLTVGDFLYTLTVRSQNLLYIPGKHTGSKG